MTSILPTRPTLRILGTRGIPAAHGGFETFAEYLSLYLVDRGWNVVVYCQDEGQGPIFEDRWEGVTRVHVPVRNTGPLGTIIFDWRATLHAASHADLCLTLGYNTAAFCALLRIKGVPNVINMDGIEWSRAKWGKVAKTWFWLNERAGCWLGDHLIADHPAIKAHLSTRVRPEKITTIAYGAPAILSAPVEPVKALGLTPGRYMTLIARAEPENSLLEVVEGFSARTRGIDLVVLGNYDEARNPYHRAVKRAAGPEVKFVGAIYDKPIVQALRFHSMAYIHGHQVGGTNPSLVEALGAGNAVIAHDNIFNRWVVGDGGRFFTSADSIATVLDEVLADPGQLAVLAANSRSRFNDHFTWSAILGAYERVLLPFVDGWSRRPVRT